MKTTEDMQAKFKEIIGEELIKKDTINFVDRSADRITSEVNKIIERSKKMEDTLLEIRSQFSDTNRFQALTLQIDKILKE